MENPVENPWKPHSDWTCRPVTLVALASPSSISGTGGLGMAGAFGGCGWRCWAKKWLRGNGVMAMEATGNQGLAIFYEKWWKTEILPNVDPILENSTWLNHHEPSIWRLDLSHLVWLKMEDSVSSKILIWMGIVTVMIICRTCPIFQ